jgi:ABC-2 type transport system ATP-binding protein
MPALPVPFVPMPDAPDAPNAPGTTSPPVLAVDAFTKLYGETVAVKRLDLHVLPGNVVGLLGPNGAGKSTTLKAIAGIIRPTAGTVRICGHDVIDDPVAAKKHLAYVPDEPRLYDELTVLEHLRFHAAVYGMPSDAPSVETAAAPLLERFELVEHKAKLGADLSRGMRQKVAVCCALLHNPRLVLLDEPLTGLDPRGIRTMKDSIRARAAAGTAFVISSHLLDLIQDLCDTLLIIDHGEVRYAGDIQGARRAFAGEQIDASLEEIFFKATEPGAAHAPASPPAPGPHSATGHA